VTQTAKAWLDELTTLYTPTPSESDAARRHRVTIEARLDVYLGLHEMFEIGSLRHGTGVWQHSDAGSDRVREGLDVARRFPASWFYCFNGRCDHSRRLGTLSGVATTGLHKLFLG